MGSVVGEKITRLFERALERQRAGDRVLGVGRRAHAGGRAVADADGEDLGGAGAAARGRACRTSRCCCTRPPAASRPASRCWATSSSPSPKALIGFAGARVIQNTIRQRLPPGFQRAEFLLEHGFLDKIVHRRELRATLAQPAAPARAARQPRRDGAGRRRYAALLARLDGRARAGRRSRPRSGCGGRWPRLGDPQRRLRGRPDRRHQRQGLDRRDDRGDPARGRPAHGALSRRRTWRASPSASASTGARPTAIGWRRSIGAWSPTGVPLTYFEVATVLAFLAIRRGRGRDRRAGDRPRRPARRGHDLRAVRHRDHLDRPRPHRATSATRWRRSRARRPASSSRTCRASSGRLPPEADDEIAARRDAAGAPLFRLRPRLRPPPFPTRACRARISSENAALAVAAGARGRPPPRAADRRSGDGARAGRRHAGRAGCERVGDDLLFDCAHNVDGAAGPGRRAARAGAGPPHGAAWCRSSATRIADAMLAALAPVAAAVVATRSDNPRALAPDGAGGDAPRATSPTPSRATTRSPRSTRRAAAPARAGWWSSAARCSWSGCCARACWASPSTRCRRPILFSGCRSRRRRSFPGIPSTRRPAG